MIKPTDRQLHEAIDMIFSKYDTDKSNTLDFQEVKQIVVDTFKSSGDTRRITDEDVRKFVGEVDEDSDGKITRQELYAIFKKIIDNFYKRQS